MSVGYTGVQWNRQKKWYDGALAGLLLLAFLTYVAVSAVVRPQITVESLIIRGSAISAFLLLHVILLIGPLARLDRRFLPLLFNRRHLGVTMFLLALLHAAFSIFQFHASGDTNPLLSVFTAYARDYRSLPHFPFEPFGALALAILFVMAATSHDFWLKRLGPSFWKALHLLVLVAYGALVVHVSFGALQSEQHPIYPILLGVGLVSVYGLHLVAAFVERGADRDLTEPADDGFLVACPVDRLRPDRGTTVAVAGERVAVFLHDDRVYAVSNVCRHQGGPLGEGRVLKGCITCPWHGWQYRPADGCSPPPFEEKIETYRTRVHDGMVWVHPESNPPGTAEDGSPVRARS